MRTAAEDGPFWDLHRIDPVEDSVVGRVRLPSRAPYVGLLPGPDYWLMEEAKSGLEDLFREPTGYFLLEAEAIREGRELSCD